MTVFPSRSYLLPFLALLAQAVRGQDVASPTPAAPAMADSRAWTLHEQATWIDQGHPAFDSPYEGPNSLSGSPESERTFSSSIFLGFQIGPGFEFYYNPEIIQGHGVSGTKGMAGVPNGEAVKAGFANLHYNTSRLFIRKTIGLGGETEKVDDDVNQVAGIRDVSRIVLSAGKFSANDFFDDNAYSHDARLQFMNGSFWESCAWDYPADEVGYTAGMVAEWYAKAWTFRYGIFMEPTVSNGSRLDYHVLDANGQIFQVDRSYSLGDLAGSWRPFVFWNRAKMGNYSDALAIPDITDALFETRAYRSKVGFGISWDQELTQDLGAFARVSWDDGRTESFAFTEIDRSLALGISLKGGRWGRKDDTFGLAVCSNGISPGHQAYLAAGGTQGLFLGDGALNYGPEEILETYYRIQATKWLSISPDFQFANHPGYNRDRGPVPLYTIRVHVEF